MTSNRDDDLLSYFPRKGNREFNSEDILGSNDESLMRQGNAWDSQAIRRRGY